MATHMQALIAILTVTKIQLRTLNDLPCGYCELTTDFETPFLMIRGHFAQPNETKGDTRRFYYFEYLDFVTGDIKCRDFKLNGSKHSQNLISSLYLSFFLLYSDLFYLRIVDIEASVASGHTNDTQAHTHIRTLGRNPLDE